MKDYVHQGDILKIENIKTPVLAVSKDFFNRSEEIIGCPIITEGQAGALHIPINGKHISGFAHCEKLTLLDLKVRGFSRIDSIPIEEIKDITDAIQGIFDYI